jgi:hypothetical protein
MIPLAGPAFPRSNQELGEAVAAGFNRHHLAAREVLVEGGTFPAVETLRIDLSGAEATRELRGAARGPATGGQQVIAARLEVLAEPLLFEGTPLRLRLTAEQADFPPWRWMARTSMCCTCSGQQMARWSCGRS